MNKCISCGEGESSDGKFSQTLVILLEGGEFLNETYINFVILPFNGSSLFSEETQLWSFVCNCKR
jgi:hypothetical protein